MSYKPHIGHKPYWRGPPIFNSARANIGSKKRTILNTLPICPIIPFSPPPTKQKSRIAPKIWAMRPFAIIIYIMCVFILP